MGAVMLKPLICFHPSKKYLVSVDYSIESQPNLEKLDTPSPKVFHIDYEWGQNLPHDKIPLYPSQGFKIYDIHSYELLDSSELLKQNWMGSYQKTKDFSPLISKEFYQKAVKEVLQKISLGYFYQLNYTLPFQANFDGNEWGIFKHYHKLFSGDFHALLPDETYSVISLSPELFLEKKNKELTTKPIKGTAQTAEAILHSEKENAELSMIVDLLRNDLNAVADLMPAQVLQHRAIMDLSHLVHTYSEISAQTSLPLSQILKKMLPGGSISGCPKKEACLTIHDLEPYRRQAYTGIIGFSEGTNALMSIAIRTFIATKEKKIYYHSGGGIVFDSKWEKEYDELLLKASRI